MMSTYGKRANLAEVFSDKVDDISHYFKYPQVQSEETLEI
jgi:hypothetical protein